MSSLHSGRAEVHVLELGSLSCPGFAVYGNYPDWERFHQPDAQGLVRFPTRALLATFPSRTVLVDCGYGIDFSNELAKEFVLDREPFLTQALGKFGVSRSDITDVVLTHPHFDHVSGAIDKGSPTFSEARYYIQKRAWDHAPDLEWKNDLDSHIDFLEGDTELFPGLRTILTGGHSAGHQAVLVENLLFPADICPTRLHLKPDCIMHYDVEPEDTRVAKKALLAEGQSQGWTLVFSHDPEQAYLQL